MAIVLAAAAPAFAQGHVAGTVHDVDGKPIKGATITAQNPDAAPSTFTSSSDTKGRFSLLGLRGGTWKVNVEAPGFQSETARLQTHSLGANPRLEIVLQPARVPASAGPLEGIPAAALQQQLDAASALAAAGNDAAAITAYKQILSRVPALTTVHLALGLLFERQHDLSAARSEYDALLRADPSNARARAALDTLAKQMETPHPDRG